MPFMEGLTVFTEALTVYSEAVSVYSESMTEDELHDIVRTLRRTGTDNAAVEAKAASKRLPKDVWETVSAFANGEGGVIILGLDEADGFSVVPHLPVKVLVDQLVDGLAQGRDSARITPVPPHSITTMSLDDGEVVVVRIDSLRGVDGVRLPCHVIAEGVARGSYKRVHDHDQRLSGYEVYLLENSNRPARVDRQSVEGRGLDDLDEGLLRSFLGRMRRNGSRALDHVNSEAEALERVGVLTPSGEPTLAAFLALGKYPQQDYPQLFIDVTVHPGSERGGDGSVRFLDRKLCDGPLAIAVDDAVTFVLAALSTRRRVAGVAGVDEGEIPEDVIREAIVNAVIHRDYSAYAQGEQVAVDIHPDRITVTNPGGFMMDRTPDNLLDGRSVSRNELLARLMMNVPLRDGRGVLVENQGSGILRMVAAMRARGLGLPDYTTSDIDHVRLVLMRVAPVRLRDDDLASKVVALFAGHEELRIAQIADLLGKSAGVLRPVLRRLVDSGVLEATAPPTSRLRAYRRGRVPVAEPGMEPRAH